MRSDEAIRDGSGWRDHGILIALLLAQLVGVMEISMTYAAIPSFYRIFGNSDHMVWLYTSFLLVAGISSALFGSLGDTLGRRKILILVLIVAGIGSAVALFAPNLEWIIVGRTLQGVCIAITPLCVGLIREHMSEASMPRGIAFLMIAAHSASGIFFLIGGAVIDHFGWRWVFALTVLATAFAIVAVRSSVPRSAPATGEGRAAGVDWLGALVFGLSVAALLLALNLASTHGYGDQIVLLSGIVGLGLLGFWIPYSLRQRAPLIDIRLLGRKQVAITLAIFTFFCMGVQQYPMIIIVLLQQPLETGAGFGLSATHAGATQIPASIAGLVAGIASGTLAARHGGRIVLLTGTTLVGAGWMMFYFGQQTLWLFLAGMMFVYAGIAAVFTGASVLLVQGVPESRTSEVIGLSEVIRTIGTAFGAQLVSLIFVGAMVKDAGSGGAFPSAEAYSHAIGGVVLICILATLATAIAPFRKELPGGKALGHS